MKTCVALIGGTTMIIVGLFTIAEGVTELGNSRLSSYNIGAGTQARLLGCYSADGT